MAHSLPLPTLTPVIHVRADQLRIGDLVRGGEVISLQRPTHDDRYVVVGIRSRRSYTHRDQAQVTERLRASTPVTLFKPEYA